MQYILKGKREKIYLQLNLAKNEQDGDVLKCHNSLHTTVITIIIHNSSGFAFLSLCLKSQQKTLYLSLSALHDLSLQKQKFQILYVRKKLLKKESFKFLN